jgi:selenocysteine lyase/cysteine desulfurase
VAPALGDDRYDGSVTDRPALPRPGSPAPSPDALVELIRSSVIGDDEAVAGPFGVRRVTYADYTASGRSLAFIEDYIREQVMPLYANTHTESSGTGRQTTRFREDARDIIRAAVGATPGDHEVIFCGSGSTAAVDKLIGILNLRIPADLERRYDLRSHIPAAERPVVFIGPYEHHSNELPWRESIADVITIRENANGHIDLAHLDDELTRHADRDLKIGSFSAASNVTGIHSGTRSISTLLHRHGALTFWDYGAAAPYVGLRMDPHRPAPSGDDSEAALDYKDAVFISPHKFIGGPGTPGLLVVRRALLTNTVPTVPGGGTVAYVTADEHIYLDDAEHREEGGTPAIIESIRAGLVFQLKEAVGVETIRNREESFIQRALDRWNGVPDLEILGDLASDRLSIVSFVVRHGSRYLHHDYVVALLNDLFAIQSRGGCSCAGPYGHRLLGIDIETSHEFEREVTRGCESIRPGWIRVNFNYFISETVFEYILDAVELIARDGWRLLPDYRLDPATGRWHHAAGQVEAPLSLHDIGYDPSGMHFEAHRRQEPETRLADYLALARLLMTQPPPPPLPPQKASDLVVGEDFEGLRWFLLPDEAASELART